MKRFSFLLVLCLVFSCLGCKSVSNSSAGGAQSVELVRPDKLSAQESAWFDWLIPRADSILVVYRERHGNFIDPDEVRKAFAPIGYDGTNVPAYRKLEKSLVRKLYRDILADVVSKEQNPTILFLTGCGGSGKSTATQNNPSVKEKISNSSVVYDSALNSYSSLNEVIKLAIKAGIREENITVVPVYNDMVTSFSNSVARGLKSGRFLSIQYVVTDAFPSNKGKIAKLHKKHRKISIFPIDNAGNNGGKQVSVDEAAKWDYNVKDSEVNKILDIYENLVRMKLSGEITEKQLKAVNTGLVNVGLYQGLSDATRLRIAQLAQ